MVIRIKFLEDEEPLFLRTGDDEEFISLEQGQVFKFPDDFKTHYGKKYEGEFIAIRKLPDDSPLNNCGDILIIKRKC